jgi:hypothetical protein
VGAAEKIVVLTSAELVALVDDAVRKALDSRQSNDNLYKTRAAAEYVGETYEAFRRKVARGIIMPDKRGRTGTGGASNEFSRATLDAYRSGKR